MIEVIGTREGLLGKRTATGWTIDTTTPFVALPSTKAKHRTIVALANGQAVLAQVLDVGPWNEHDDAYVLQGARPAAESGVDQFGRKTNRAGIDLGEAVWKALRMKDNGPVRWAFVKNK